MADGSGNQAPSLKAARPPNRPPPSSRSKLSSASPAHDSEISVTGQASDARNEEQHPGRDTHLPNPQLRMHQLNLAQTLPRQPRLNPPTAAHSSTYGLPPPPSAQWGSAPRPTPTLPPPPTRQQHTGGPRLSLAHGAPTQPGQPSADPRRPPLPGHSYPQRTGPRLSLGVPEHPHHGADLAPQRPEEDYHRTRHDRPRSRDRKDRPESGSIEFPDDHSRSRREAPGGHPSRSQSEGQGGHRSRDQYEGQGGHRSRGQYEGQGGHRSSRQYEGQGGHRSREHPGHDGAGASRRSDEPRRQESGLQLEGSQRDRDERQVHGQGHNGGYGNSRSSPDGGPRRLQPSGEQQQQLQWSRGGSGSRAPRLGGGRGERSFRGRGGGGRGLPLAAGVQLNQEAVEMLPELMPAVQAAAASAGHEMEVNVLALRPVGMDQMLEAERGRSLPSRRPQHAVQVEVNHFLVKFPSRLVIQQYAVVFSVVRQPVGEGADPDEVEAGEEEEIRSSSEHAYRALLRQAIDKLRWGGGWAHDGRGVMYAPEGWHRRYFEPAVLLRHDGRQFVAAIVRGSNGRGRMFNYKVEISMVRGNQQQPRLHVRELLDSVAARPHVPDAEALVTALEIFMKHSALHPPSRREPQMIVVGASVFPLRPRVPDEAETCKDPRYQIVIGYRQAMQVCRMGVTLCLDMAVRVFFAPEALITHVAKVLGNPLRGDQNSQFEATIRYLRQELGDRRGRQKIVRQLKGVKVEVSSNPGSTFGIKELTPESAEEYIFPLRRRGHPEVTISVADYYRDLKHKLLLFPKAPLVAVTGNSHARFPMELCSVVPGQPAKFNIAAREVITKAAVLPNDRKQKILELRRLCAVQADGSAAQRMGLQIEPAMAKVPVKLLAAPVLEYGRETCVEADKGSWRPDKGLPFLAGGRVRSWGVVSYAGRGSVRGLTEFIHKLGQRLQGLGSTWPLGHFPEPVFATREDPRDVHADFEEAVRRAQQWFGHKPDLMLIVMPEKGARQYKEAKAYCYEHGFPSQAFHAAVCEKPWVYCDALAHKISGKLEQHIANGQLEGKSWRVAGGITRLGLGLNKRVMVLGIDVSHGQTQAHDGPPSTAAVVASMDSDLVVYRTRVWAQGEANQELLATVLGEEGELQRAVQGLLQEYQGCNGGLLPEALIVYRDGVSNGQFATVLNFEVDAIKQACAALGGDTISMTFLTIQKRHNTRFFPPRGAQVTDRFNGDNLVAGSLCDEGITHPHHFDFYLASHQAIKGTSRAAHYHVLLEENQLPSEAIQRFTYWLCYLYARCTRSVSYATPAYYAHLAAEKARMMFSGGRGDDASSAASDVLGVGADMRPIHPRILNTPFFL